jgi:hypothetical protein
LLTITCAEAEFAVRGRGPPPVPSSTSLVCRFRATTDRPAAATMPTPAKKSRRLIRVVMKSVPWSSAREYRSPCGHHVGYSRPRCKSDGCDSRLSSDCFQDQNCLGFELGDLANTFRRWRIAYRLTDPSAERHATHRKPNRQLAVVKRLGALWCDWLGRRDSNPNNRVQSAVSYR